jgi:hypothetical protein
VGIHQQSARALSDAVASLKNLRTLSVRGVPYGVDLPFVLEGVRRSQLVELNVEDTNCDCDVELSDAVRVCDSLRALVISSNPRLLGANATCQAVCQSRVERFEARKVGLKVTGETLEALAAAPRLLFLDLRGTELDTAHVSLFLSRMRASTRLYSLKLQCASARELFEMLGSNTTLGMVSVTQLDFTSTEAPRDCETECLKSMGDNSSLFVLDPLPQSYQALRTRIGSNYQIAKKVRVVILLILMAHKFYRPENDFAVFPKDVIVLIMKSLWSMRRDRAWSAVRY